jgi:large subunit ribosomal protein L2
MILSKYKHKLNYLYSRKKKIAGRNNTGRITVFHQGGGHKQKLRIINFKGDFSNGIVTNFEYDPNRSARLAKVCFLENNIKKFYYILAPQNINVLDTIESSVNKENLLKKNVDDITNAKLVGSCYFLSEFSIGDYIYNIELTPNLGGQLVRAGGTSAVILQKTDNFVLVKLPSSEQRLIPANCKAFFGNLSNENHIKVI